MPSPTGDLEKIPRRILRDQLNVMRAYAKGRTPDVIYPSVIIDEHEETVHQTPLTYELAVQANEAAVYFFTALRDGTPEKNALIAEYQSLLPLIESRRKAEIDALQQK